jgi:hypothetical protein
VFMRDRHVGMNNGISVAFFTLFISAMSHYDPAMFDFVSAAASALPVSFRMSVLTSQSLIGVKYVEVNNADWFRCVQTFNKTHALLYAPEPKVRPQLPP